MNLSILEMGKMFGILGLSTLNLFFNGTQKWNVLDIIEQFNNKYHFNQCKKNENLTSSFWNIIIWKGANFYNF